MDAAADGDDANMPPADANESDAARSAAPLSGKVYLYQRDVGDIGWRLRVSFRRLNPNSDLPCSVRRVGECYVEDCRRDSSNLSLDSTVPVSAGVVSVEGGATTLTATPERSGYYMPLSGAGALFEGGESLRVSAAGDANGVPAFRAMLTAPGAMQVHALPFVGGAGVIPRDAPFRVTWEPGTGSVESVMVHLEVTEGGTSFQTRNVEAICVAPRTAGAVEIPTEVLGLFPAGVAGNIAVLGASVMDSPVGEYPVAVFVTRSATFPDGSITAVSATVR
jgi:hypothetical protein